MLGGQVRCKKLDMGTDSGNTISYAVEGSPSAEIYLTKTTGSSGYSANIVSNSSVPILYQLKEKKIVKNKKLKKNDAPTTVLTAWFYPEKGVEVMICVDTGGEASCISMDYLKKYFPFKEMGDCKLSLIDVGSQRVPVLGTVTLDLLLKSLKDEMFTLPMVLLVVESLNSGLLLGTDTCLLNNFVINFDSQSILTEEVSFQARSEVKTDALSKLLKKHGIYAIESRVI